ncbi:MAG: glycoside hydrolase/phage tail family protein, partial [Caulobacteraceae bacterium]|nr:glycoside hydrolase/phage tail family protein [Caulobacter sp.]
MATVMLSAAGGALGGAPGAFLGRFAGAAVDALALGALTPARQVGARLSGLQLSSTAEGAPMPAAFGRARVAGQVIWAARFKEARVEQATGGGKGGPKAYSYSYSLSFAVAVAEGPIQGLGRVWADGAIMDMTGVVMRTYLGGPDQAPDPLIEAVEGSAPAYRGVAYVVFEDLALDAYGSRPPQLSFEVFRRPPGSGALEDRLKSVCLIPGAGEFVLAGETVLRRDGLATTTPENMNNSVGRPDLLVALDQLQAQLPNVEEVSLVVAWFGDDLRAGRCRVRPGVDQPAKSTTPQTWGVAGYDRAGAHQISRHDGGAAYGGTPSDVSVLQAIAELKARGLKVVLYPFLLMDVPPGNGLPDPYGGAEQAAYPWRGRITTATAPGRPGASDKTAAAAQEVAAFFAEYQALALHCADLAVQAGGVDGFLIGSELRGLTTLRSDASTYPAVQALRDLAARCRVRLGPTCRIGYGADWSEWSTHAPNDGSGDLHFHLDPLWADPNLDFIGVDFYPPLADWAAGAGGVDAAAGFGGPHDAAYLAANVAGGEDFDWFYASAADRAAQRRTPITDFYGEPWVYRAKDLVSWWSNLHHDRPGGVRAAQPTGWTPGLKPIRLTEFGCPAVDRGANSPNLFVDPKSAESALPAASTGLRDDTGQRRALEAVLAHFDQPPANPVSPVYGGPMLEGASAWCWDARPYPDFPARAAVWADASDWTLGHWLTGRMGGLQLADLAQALAARAGLGEDLFDASAASGSVTGYVVDAPVSVAEALQPLAAAYPFDAAEGPAGVRLLDRDAGPCAVLALEALAPADDRAGGRTDARTLQPTPDLVRVRYVDADADYQTGSLAVRAQAPGGGGPAVLDLELVGDEALAQAAGARLLARTLAERDAVTLNVAPLEAVRFTPGDVLRLGDDPARWRVLRADADEAPRLTLARAEPPAAPVPAGPPARAAPAAVVAAPVALQVLDLPPLPGFEEDARPVLAACASPWRPQDVWAGGAEDSLTRRAGLAQPAVMGVTLSDLPAGPRFRHDRATRLRVRVEGGPLASASEAAVLGGANALAVRGAGGDWEVLQFATAELEASSGLGGTYLLSGLLRAQCGSDPAMADLTPAGADVVLLADGLGRATVSLAERTLPRLWRSGPAGAPPGGPSSTEV